MKDPRNQHFIAWKRDHQSREAAISRLANRGTDLSAEGSAKADGPASTGQSRRGSVVIVVLLTLLFASFLLTRLIEASSTDLLIAMRVADRDHLRADAYAALETTLAALMDFRAVDNGLYAPTQGWSDPLGYAGFAPREGVTLEVTFEDESAKLSLPRINFDTMNALLVQLGLSTRDATRVADALFVWMRNGHVAAETATSATVYEQGDPSAQPPYRSLRSFDELASIAVAREFFYDKDGRPTQLWHDFVRAVSLYQFATTNLNSAPATVLMASGWDASQADTMQKYLATPVSATKTRPYLRSVREARGQVGNVATRNLGAQIQCLRINIAARQGAALLRLSALVTWSGQAALPPPLAANPGNAPAVTGSRPTPVAAAQTQANAAAANSIRYPFTVLELSETTLPEPLPSA